MPTSSNSKDSEIHKGECNDSYPIEAVNNQIQGFVKLSFDIDQQGHTNNITVVESVPEGVFDKAGSCSLSKWLYKPNIVNSKPVYQTDLKVQLDFKLDNGSYKNIMVGILLAAKALLKSPYFKR